MGALTGAQVDPWTHEVGLRLLILGHVLVLAAAGGRPPIQSFARKLRVGRRLPVCIRLAGG
jgi:hypothetical protein